MASCLSEDRCLMKIESKSKLAGVFQIPSLLRRRFNESRPSLILPGHGPVHRYDLRLDPEQDHFRMTSCVGSDQIGFLSHNELDRFLFFAPDQPPTTNHPQRLLTYHYGSHATHRQGRRYTRRRCHLTYHYGSHATRMVVGECPFGILT